MFIMKAKGSVASAQNRTATMTEDVELSWRWVGRWRAAITAVESCSPRRGSTVLGGFVFLVNIWVSLSVLLFLHFRELWGVLFVETLNLFYDFSMYSSFWFSLCYPCLSLSCLSIYLFKVNLYLFKSVWLPPFSLISDFYSSLIVSTLCPVALISVIGHASLWRGVY